jgi:hypothetical protein
MRTEPSEDIVKTILELDTVLQRASSTYDGATIRGLISDDFTLISSSGRIMNAEDFIQDVEDRSVVWHQNDTEEAHVRSYNEDCAVIAAVLRSRFETAGKLHDVRVRFTDTWVRLNGAWRYVAGHASRLQAPA